MAHTEREVKQTTSCGALAWRTNEEGTVQVCLVKQFANRDSWGIPKGHMKEGETLEECALREVKEETGLSVVLGDRLPDAYANYGNEKKTVVTYVAQLSDPTEPLHVGHPECEVADVRWFEVTSLPRIHIYQQSLVQEAVKKLLGG